MLSKSVYPWHNINYVFGYINSYKLIHCVVCTIWLINELILGFTSLEFVRDKGPKDSLILALTKRPPKAQHQLCIQMVGVT